MKYQTLTRLLLLATVLTLGSLVWLQGAPLMSGLRKWQKIRALYLHIQAQDSLLLNSPLDARTLYNRGVLRVQAGELALALQDFQQALRFAPRDADTLYNLAWVQIRLRKNQEALRSLNQLMQWHPAHLDGRWNRAWLYQQLQQPERARQEYLWLQRHSTQLSLEAQARLAVILNQSARARELYSQILKKHPQQVDALLGRARLLLAQGQPEAALQDLEQGLQVSSRVELHQARAEALLALKRVNEALQAYTQALTLKPSASLYQARAALYLERGQLEQARSDYYQALILNPDNARLHLMVARLYAQRRQTREALQSLQAALRLAPGLKQEILATREFLRLRTLPEFQQMLRNF